VALPPYRLTYRLYLPRLTRWKHIGPFADGGMLPISPPGKEVLLPAETGLVNDTGAPMDIAAEQLAVPRVEPMAGERGDSARRSRPRRAPVDCGDLPFLIKRDGTWLYRGTPINRKELVCLFASVLRREEDGSWWLQTPAERGRIEVEDAPFVAVELDWAGEGRHQMLSFRTNIDEVVTAGPEHPIRISHDLFTCEPTPYIRLRSGAAAHLAIEARINRATYYELVALAVPEWVGNKRALGVWSCGKFFSLGELPPGEA
jgi:hypothetical protein